MIFPSYMKTSHIMLIVANNVRRLRKAKGWSQEDLAEKSGLHRTYIGAIERAEQNITVETLARVAAALGCKAERLLSEQREK